MVAKLGVSIRKDNTMNAPMCFIGTNLPWIFWKHAVVATYDFWVIEFGSHH